LIYITFHSIHLSWSRGSSLQEFSLSSCGLVHYKTAEYRFSEGLIDFFYCSILFITCET